MLRLLIAAIAAVTLLPPAYADDEQANPGAHILQAEIALSRGEYRRAAVEYRKAAELGNSAENAARATQVADKFGFNDEALRSAKRWPTDRSRVGERFDGTRGRRAIIRAVEVTR